MRTDKKYQMGILGCGNMGIAIAKGAVKNEYLERWQICAYDPDETAQELCRQEGITLMENEADVVRNAHVVLFAMKQNQVDDVIKAIGDEPVNCVLSIVTGLSISFLQDRLNHVPVIRALPDTPLQINEGSTALCRSSNCKADEYDFVFQLFQSMGVTRTIPEDKISETAALHSLSAYIYYFVQSMLEDAKSRGVDEDSARALITQTVIGTGKLLREHSRQPIYEFIDEVALNDDTIIEALTAMLELNMFEIIHQANEKCIARAEHIETK